MIENFLSIKMGFLSMLQVSMVEVYNESVYDLLVPPEDGHEKLTIQSKGKNVSVPVSACHVTHRDQ